MSILTAFPRPAHTRAHRPASIAIGAAMATAVAAMMATVPLAAAAAAQVVSFEATAAGSFWIPGDVGTSSYLARRVVDGMPTVEKIKSVATGRRSA